MQEATPLQVMTITGNRAERHPGLLGHGPIACLRQVGSNEERENESHPTGRDGDRRVDRAWEPLAFDMHVPARQIEVHVTSEIEIADTSLFEHVGLLAPNVRGQQNTMRRRARLSGMWLDRNVHLVRDEMDVTRREVGHMVKTQFNETRRVRPLHPGRFGRPATHRSDSW
jgi:hypothetical protein